MSEDDLRFDEPVNEVVEARLMAEILVGVMLGLYRDNSPDKLIQKYANAVRELCVDMNLEIKEIISKAFEDSKNATYTEDVRLAVKCILQVKES